jgi:hypothetical protein
MCGPAWGLAGVAAIGILLAPHPARAQVTEKTAAEMARELQDPLADIRLLTTGSTIGFRVGPQHKPSDSTLLQAVRSFDLGGGYSFVARPTIPLLVTPPTAAGEEPFPTEAAPPVVGTRHTIAGLGDSGIQGAFAFPGEFLGLRWGFGPEISFATHTDPILRSADWGAGPVMIAVGASEALSYGTVVSHLSSFDGRFSTTSLQPFLWYNFESSPGVAVGYSSTITANWKAKPADRVTLPVGLSLSRFLLLADSYGLELSAGGYAVPIKPADGPSWQLFLGVTLLLP